MIGYKPPASAAWGYCDRDYPRAAIVSPYKFKTAKDHYEALLDEARRSELVTRLRGILTEEENGNLNAALARRPLAKGNGLRAGVSGNGMTFTVGAAF